MKFLKEQILSKLVVDTAKRFKLLFHPKASNVAFQEEFEMAPERRKNLRNPHHASICLTKDGRELPVIESSFSGARVVLSDSYQRGDTVEIIVQNRSRVLESNARVAWISRMGTGRVVAGLEF